MVGPARQPDRNNPDLARHPKPKPAAQKRKEHIASLHNEANRTRRQADVALKLGNQADYDELMKKVHQLDREAATAEKASAAKPAAKKATKKQPASKTVAAEPTPTTNTSSVAAPSSSTIISDSAGVHGYSTNLASQYGLTITSETRSAAHNAEVGGATHSDHLSGFATDLSGDPAKMANLYAWAKANEGPGKLFRYVANEGDHIHLSYNKGGDTTKVAPAGASTTPTGTTTTTSPAVESIPISPQSSPDDIEKYIRANYPDVAGLINNPEIRQVLFSHVGEDPTEIEAAIRKTNYYATHGPDSRAFDLLIAQDGKAAGDLVDNVKGTIGDLLARQGVTLTDQQLGEVAKNVIRSGWVDLDGNIVNQGKLGDFVGFVLRRSTDDGVKALPDGEAAANVDKLRQIAKAYFVPMTEKDLNDWAIRAIEGTATEESFISYVSHLAKGRFANDKGMLAAIDSGVAPADYLAPVKNMVGQTLELDPGTIDFTDPKWASLMETVDPNSGEKRSLTLGEAAQWARNQPGYSTTNAYRQSNADFALKMAQTFGAI